MECSQVRASCLWSQVARVRFKYQKQRCFMIKLLPKRFPRHLPLYFGLQCTKREAVLIRNEIRRRIAAAKEKAQLDKA